MAHRTTLLAAAAGLAMTSATRADNRNWDSPVGGMFNVAGNWSPALVPGSADRATFNQSANYTVTLPNANVTTSELFVRNDTVVFNLTGRILTMTGANSLVIGGGGGHGTPGEVGQLTLANSSVNQALVNTVSASIGGSSGVLGSGTLRIQPNVTWNNSGFIFVGSSSPGFLYISGGDVNTFASVIGQGRPATATIGVGSQWIHQSSLDVGANANGTLIVSTTALVRDTEAIVGGAAGVTGSVTVTGAGSRWETNGLFNLGLNGAGNLQIDSGGFVQAGGGLNQCSVADGSSSTGSLTVAGTNSRMYFASGPTHFGRMGAATININTGGKLDHLNSACLGSILGTCNATITGVGSRWVPGQSMYVGGTASAPGGSATLNITNYGFLQIGSAGTLKIWDSGIVNLSGGIIQTGAFSNSGTFNWSSGTLHLLSACPVGASGPLGSAVIINTGRILQAADFTVNGVPGTFLNAPGGTIISDYGLVIASSSQGQSSFTNNGQLVSRGLTVGQSPSSYGTLLADGPGTHLNLGAFPDNQDMHIGKAGTGLLTVSGGALATVDYNILNIGNDAGSHGTVTVTGAASQLSMQNYYLSVGRYGSGTLEVLSGGRVNGTALIGENAGATGTVRIAGAGSIWTANSITVGQIGSGSLTIESGANLTTNNLATSLLTGASAQVTLTGQGSSLISSAGGGLFGQIIVGGNDTSTMLIDQAATATCVESFIGDGTTATGTLTLRNNAAFTASEELAVGYNGRGTLSIESGADVTTQALVISVQGAAQGQATVTGAGSTLNTATMDIGTGASGLLSIASGGLAQASGPVNIHSAGTVALSGGTLNAIAANVNGGTLKGSGVAAANVTNSGTVSPGNSAGLFTIQGNYAQTPAGNLAIEIGGVTPGTQHDQLAISGPAALAGTLIVSRINSYQFRPGDSFTIVTAASVTGTFSTVNLPSVTGGSLKLVYTPTTVSVAYCYSNCDGSTTTPNLTANDFVCFLNAYTAGAAYANCDGSTSAPVLTANDFVCFLNTYVGGCP